MKNIYMFQPNYLYGNQAHVPYAAGVLAAYAWHEKEIKENYVLKKIQFIREDIDKVVSEMEEPFLCAFSTYMWNFNYNILLARKIKEACPDCIIVFGGHQITPDSSMVNEYPFIDVLIQGEGEEPFLRLLRSYAGLEAFEEIPNIAYRKNDKLIIAKREYYNYSDYPSPYLEGTFDRMLEENPETEFIFLFESNRGCPYHCAYCDWGTLKGKMRLFSEERTLAEFRWMAEHKIDFCGCADSNFGIYARDEEYIDFLIELKNATGYPKKFQASFAKHNTERIFRIGKKLSENGMNKGITLAFQSMCPEALAIIGRTNITIEFFEELMRKYNEADIPTYTELILGLPGETYNSYADGIDKLLCAGQHQTIYVHNCELLPGSDIGNPEFIKKYKVKAHRIPLNQPHMSTESADDIPEYSRIITSTFSMSEEDWVKTNLFSDIVQCFHHLGTLQFFALYCHCTLGVSYKAFYESLAGYIFSDENTCLYEIFSDIKERYVKITLDEGGLTASGGKYGDIQWSFDEFAFIRMIDNYPEIYSELGKFLLSFGIEQDIYENLLKYQINMLKKPNDKEHFIFETDYDFYSYFHSAFLNESPTLEKKHTKIEISNASEYSIADYARFVVWYGRKDSRNTYESSASILS